MKIVMTTIQRLTSRFTFATSENLPTMLTHDALGAPREHIHHRNAKGNSEFGHFVSQNTPAADPSPTQPSPKEVQDCEHDPCEEMRVSSGRWVKNQTRTRDTRTRQKASLCDTDNSRAVCLSPASLTRCAWSTSRVLLRSNTESWQRS